MKRQREATFLGICPDSRSDGLIKEQLTLFRNESTNFFICFEEYLPYITCHEHKRHVFSSIGLIIEQSVVFWIKFDKFFPRLHLMERDARNIIYMCYICSIGIHIGDEDAKHLFQKTMELKDGFKEGFFQFMQKIRFEFTLPCFNCSLNITPQNKLLEYIETEKLYEFFKCQFLEKTEEILDVVLFTFEYVALNYKKKIKFEDELRVAETMAQTIRGGKLLKDLFSSA
tara:strand:+ start:130 stop:813 length:684 start_codon:yes stop_codon:yes gene_type:complete